MGAPGGGGGKFNIRKEKYEDHWGAVAGDNPHVVLFTLYPRLPKSERPRRFVIYPFVFGLCGSDRQRYIYTTRFKKIMR